MKNQKGLLLILLSIICLACTDTVPKELQYIDKDKPGLLPKKFATGFISQDVVSEFGSVFNAEGNEFFYGIDSAGHAEIKFTKLIDGVWQDPLPLIEDMKYSYNDPFLSVNENRLYYISNMPKTKSDSISDYDIWYSEREANGWSMPINAGPMINTSKEEYYISFTSSGAMYFSSNRSAAPGRGRDFDIFKSDFEADGFQEAKPLSDSINTGMYEADVFVDPDERYLIFCSIKRSGLGSGDLYVSFKDANNEWGSAIHMGDQINTSGHELCPFVSQDGLYFFYTSNQDIYWVSMDLVHAMNPYQ